MGNVPPKPPVLRRGELLRCSRMYFDRAAAKQTAKTWAKMGFFGVTCSKAIDNMWIVRGKTDVATFAKWMSKHSNHHSDGGDCR